MTDPFSGSKNTLMASESMSCYCVCQNKATICGYKTWVTVWIIEGNIKLGCQQSQTHSWGETLTTKRYVSNAASFQVWVCCTNKHSIFKSVWTAFTLALLFVHTTLKMYCLHSVYWYQIQSTLWFLHVFMIFFSSKSLTFMGKNI